MITILKISINIFDTKISITEGKTHNSKKKKLQKFEIKIIIIFLTAITAVTEHIFGLNKQHGLRTYLVKRNNMVTDN